LLSIEKGHALAVEVKRQGKNFKPELFAQKVEQLRRKALPGYSIDTALLTLNEM
jgi:hypothetical protein